MERQSQKETTRERRKGEMEKGLPIGAKSRFIYRCPKMYR